MKSKIKKITFYILLFIFQEDTNNESTKKDGYNTNSNIYNLVYIIANKLFRKF